MKAHCPKCGSSAKFISQKPRTIDFSEVFFRCENPKCGGEVLAEVKFAMRATPSEQCFRQASGTDAAGDGYINTDC